MLFTALGYAQVGINTNNPDASSALEIESTTGGILIPRLTETQRDAISAPATGLMIYQTNGTSGFYFYDGNIWTKVDGVAGPQGTQGVAGADGTNGDDGIDGNDGSQGIQGVAGAAGIDGTNGADGTNGEDGTNGNDGAQGTQGVAGTAGTDGTDGTDGVDGLPGADGTNGVDGTNGADGQDGQDGVDGAQGPIGLTGPAGVDGLDGTQGDNGVAGPQGDIGVTGSQGETGAAGIDGAQGPTGPAGADGASYTQPTYNIGDIVNGGVVFWLDSTGQHGLVAAFSDVAVNVKWGCLGIDLPNVLNVPYNQFISSSLSGLGAEIGDGFNNTNDILQDCPTAPAALAARSYGPDWFLPSAKELNQIYINKTTLEGVYGFTGFSDYCWSSTESGNFTAWEQYFGNGQQYGNGKGGTTNVRAVRAF